MAVALEIPVAPLDEAPIKLLLFSTVLDRPAPYPKKELKLPVVLK
jgi:hypothetical protein